MKYVQYRGEIAYFVRREDGKPRWVKMGHKSDMKTWEVYKTLLTASSKSSQDLFENLAARWLKRVLSGQDRKERKPKTIEEYKRQLKKDGHIMGALGHMKVSEITPAVIDGYLTNKPSRYAANRDISLVSLILQLGIVEGLIASNPCTGISRNQERARRRPLQVGEFPAIYNQASLGVRVAMCISYATALRLSDVLSACHEDIQDGHLIVTESKTGNLARFPITGLLEHALNIAPKPVQRKVMSINNERRPIVVNSLGRAFTLDGFETMFRKAKLKADCPEVRFHDFRAKHITDKNRADRNAQLAAGHTSEAMTRDYIRDPLGRVVDVLEVMPE